MRDKICAALDMDIEGAFRAIDQLEGVVKWVKIGPALLTTQYGATVLMSAKDHGFKVFADYKFKDIPSVVGKGIANLVGVADLVTVHIDGGQKMLETAKAAAGPDMLVVGVTLLTSLNHKDLRQFGHTFQPDGPLEEWYVTKMVNVACQAGIDGIVCSARELGDIKKLYPTLFCVTPGLKMGANECDYIEEQKRDADPRWAYQQGSDLLVMGRDIYRFPDMAKRVAEIEKWCLKEPQ